MSLAQFGVKKESAYGTGLAVDRFFEFIKEDVRGIYTRQQSAGLGAALVDRADRFAITHKGASGSVDMEVLTKGFGFWLEQMLGSVATTGPAETSVYTHTGTMADLYGKSFTAQIGRPDDSGVVRPFTYEGGKVTNFEFRNSVDELLQCNIGMDFLKENAPASPAGIYVLQSQSLPTGAEVFTWGGGTITLGGTTIDVLDISVKVENSLKVDKYLIRKNTAKAQPAQDGKRQVSFSISLPFKDMTYVTKLISSSPADVKVALDAKWEGPTLLGSTIYPTLQIQVPVARLDEGIPVVEGPSNLQHTLTGVGLYDGSNSPVSVIYKSADVLP